MKTTIEITDTILLEAKRVAHEEGTTVRALVEDGLRQVLEERRAPQPFRLRRVTFKGNGLHADFRGVTWDQVRDAAFEGRGA